MVKRESRPARLNLPRLAAAVAAVCLLCIAQSAFAGSLVGWGANYQGQATLPAGDDFVAIAAGPQYSLALKADGSIVGWGWNIAGQATPPLGNDFVAIAAGSTHSLALKSNGSIVGWGANWNGEATPPAGNDFVAIVAGWGHSLALRQGGSIVGWGTDDHGQATPPAGDDFVAIAAGRFHGLALKQDGSIVGWGGDHYGQTTNIPAGNDFVAIDAGFAHSLALKQDGSIVAWGHNNYGQASPPAGNNYLAIAAGRDHNLALKADGSIVAWGWNNFGQTTNTPDGNNFVAIAAGMDHSLALTGTRAPSPDFNGDEIVDVKDFCRLAQYWREDEPSVDVAPGPFGDGIVDVGDVAVLADYWLKDMRLIAHWKLDETEGSTASDSAGEHDGTVHGEPTWQPAGGIVNGALEFDGIDDYVSTPFVLNPAAASFSVFVWVKGGLPGQVIMSQTGGANWLWANPADGTLITELRGSGRFGGTLYSQTMITDGDWHRLGLTWDGSNRVLYVDDVEVARDTQAGLAGSNGGLYFGAGENPVPPSLWLGLLDDIRIYDRAIVP